MANTYSQLYVQFVFAVKGRQALIPKTRKEEVHKYIAGVVKNRKQKLLAINCMPDHIHIFIGFTPNIALSDLVRDIKTSSSQFIRASKISPFEFNWQEGYGCFTYAHSSLDSVCQYVLKQEDHHKKKTFKQEYLEFLSKFEIPFDEKYLFTFR